MFETGSGEALMPNRTPALIPWLTSEVPPEAPPATISSAVLTCSKAANSTPIRLATAGLITVWATSQRLSR